MKIPKFNSEFVSIIDIHHLALGAVISTFLHKEGTFLNIFELGTATAKISDISEDTVDEHAISRTNLTAMNVKIHNSIKRLKGNPTVILGGLSEEQKSYLTFLDDYPCIEIDTVESVELYLSGFSYDKDKVISVKSGEVLFGLYDALMSNSILRIDENAEPLNISLGDSEGLIVIEDTDTISSVIATNYAVSINASVRYVAALEEEIPNKILYLIEEWKKGNADSYKELEAIIYPRLEGINFSNFKFGTFFTEGVPYSLFLKNIIPFTYVHLHLHVDLFIFNNIYKEHQDSTGSSVIFSPLEFGYNEETSFVVEQFDKANFHVTSLIGKNASAYNLHKFIQDYPFDLLHICSHGGEVPGYIVTRKFNDRDGIQHTIEFDEVISLSPSDRFNDENERLIEVTSKQIWKKFDNMVWKSKELKDKNYPDYVFADMLNEVHKQGHSGKKYNEIPKGNIPYSCSIKCYGDGKFISTYQAMFNRIASSYVTPIIFNNTCFSWAEISRSFIESGAGTIIGTLWSINNETAKDSAIEFYKNIFNSTILNSLSKSFEVSKGTKDENIYIMWGLHFTTLRTAKNIHVSRGNILRILQNSIGGWKQKLLTTTNSRIKTDAEGIIKWLMKQSFLLLFRQQ
ncbi:hypothetical protein [Mariniphaga sp.]|uniref:hypothetical protein n=1 Tax=Mariniphaga sp. TaxID=1954475 RepID=UPI003564ACD7